MLAPVTIELAGEPVAKGRPRFARIGKGIGGVAYTPARTRHAENALRMAAQQVMAGRPLLEGPLRMMVTAAMPVPRSWSKKKQAAALAGEIAPTKRPDADNFGKLAADSLNLVVFGDDSQIVDWRVVKTYSAKPFLKVEVIPLQAEGRQAA